MTPISPDTVRTLAPDYLPRTSRTACSGCGCGRSRSSPARPSSAAWRACIRRRDRAHALRAVPAGRRHPRRRGVAVAGAVARRARGAVLRLLVWRADEPLRAPRGRRRRAGRDADPVLALAAVPRAPGGTARGDGGLRRHARRDGRSRRHRRALARSLDRARRARRRGHALGAARRARARRPGAVDALRRRSCRAHLRRRPRAGPANGILVPGAGRGGLPPDADRLRGAQRVQRATR